MGTTELSLSEAGASQRTQEILRSIWRLERRDWTLWWTANVVILLLTAAVVVVSLPELYREGDNFYQFHLSQSLRGLVGVVLLFNLYTLYQQTQLKRMRSQLEQQIGIAAQQQVRAEEFLKLAMLDPLTGLHNRRFAQQRLVAEISRAQRHRHSLTVLLVDLNDFKQINDQFGHFAGDLVLKEFAERLNRAIRGSDLAVRMGGDEFLVLLPECQLGQVQHVLSRLAPLEVDVDGQKVTVTFSAGWTDYQFGESSDQLLHRADHALYANKHNRKEQVHPVV